MRRKRHADRAFAWLALAIFLPAFARADTVVLKNGRRIAAASVTHENGKFVCETDTGELSLPESLVDHVEKDRPASVPGGLMIPNLKSAEPAVSIAPPQELSVGQSQAASAVVHDGAIDRDALARLDIAAAKGSPDAIAAAVAGESLASQFEFGRGNLQEALSHAERALSMSPSEVPLLLDVAYIHLQRNEDSAALEALDRARRVAPDSPDVAKLTGWADYSLNRLSDAVQQWQRSQSLRPDPDVAKALERAQTDLNVESNFREGQSAHFDLRYYGGTAPGLAQDILQLLEGDFQYISSALDFIPAEPIGVVLYTNEDFSEVTRAPAWVHALNDGRIRLPVQGLDSVNPQLEAVLKHELAHSFIAQKTHDRSPTWLQEGVAQWIEGSRVGPANAAALLARYDQHQEPSLATLEGSWMNSGGDAATISYSWSLAVIEGIVANGGPSDVDRLLDAMLTAASPEAAVRAALHLDYAGLNVATGDYLRRAYSR